MSKTRGAAVATIMFMAMGVDASEPGQMSDIHISRFQEQGLVLNAIEGVSSLQLKAHGEASGDRVTDAAYGPVVERGISDTREYGELHLTPAKIMRDTVGTKLAGMGVGQKTGGYSLSITQNRWLLSGNKRYHGGNYRMHYELESVVTDRSGKVVASSTCRGDGGDKLSLDAWREDGYAKVRAYTKDVGATCAEKLLSDMGLEG
jgi:hypothetical protein